MNDVVWMRSMSIHLKSQRYQQWTILLSKPTFLASKEDTQILTGLLFYLGNNNWGCIRRDNALTPPVLSLPTLKECQRHEYLPTSSRVGHNPCRYLPKYKCNLLLWTIHFITSAITVLKRYLKARYKYDGEVLDHLEILFFKGILFIHFHIHDSYLNLSMKRKKPATE